MGTQKLLPLLFAGLFGLSQNATAQIPLFTEDFEGTSITSFLNDSETTLNSDASPCGKASVGSTADLNSANVDFNAAENASSFLAVNPEVTCGGYYIAWVSSDSLDFSAVTDSLGFKCRYFQSTTVGWGGSFSIEFSNGVDVVTFDDSIFTTTDSWTNFEVTLPPSMHQWVNITINFVAGDGIGIDDFEVFDYAEVEDTTTTSTGLGTPTTAFFNTYPNPVFDYLHWEIDQPVKSITIAATNGQIVKTQRIRNNKMINLADLPEGIYLVNMEMRDGTQRRARVIKLSR